LALAIKSTTLTLPSDRQEPLISPLPFLAQTKNKLKKEKELKQKMKKSNKDVAKKLMSYYDSRKKSI
jgi:DNA topoisomerase VI subunit B